ncbi:hypothetical protein JCM9279_001291 [Rhodotorula babjevae]
MAVPPARPRPAQPILNSTWRRVEHLVPREQLSQVEGPDGDDDAWEEDEVEYVTLDFGSYLEAKALAEHDAIQLLAPESTMPMVLLGDRYFQGIHEPLVGSDILLLRNDQASPPFQPFTTSAHRISFQPVALVPPSGMADALGVPPAPRARGKGARDAPSGSAAAAAAEEEPAPPELGPDGLPKRKRGRPKGSKNKPKPFSIGEVTGEAALSEAEPAPAESTRGRKGKERAVEPAVEEEEGEGGPGEDELMNEA